MNFVQILQNLLKRIVVWRNFKNLLKDKQSSMNCVCKLKLSLSALNPERQMSKNESAELPDAVRGRVPNVRWEMVN